MPCSSICWQVLKRSTLHDLDSGEALFLASMSAHTRAESGVVFKPPVSQPQLKQTALHSPLGDAWAVIRRCIHNPASLMLIPKHESCGNNSIMAAAVCLTTWGSMRCPSLLSCSASANHQSASIVLAGLAKYRVGHDDAVHWSLHGFGHNGLRRKAYHWLALPSGHTVTRSVLIGPRLVCRL